MTKMWMERLKQSLFHFLALSLGTSCTVKSPSRGAGMGKTAEGGQWPLLEMWKVLTRKDENFVLERKIHRGKAARSLPEEIVSSRRDSSGLSSSPPRSGGSAFPFLLFLLASSLKLLLHSGWWLSSALAGRWSPWHLRSPSDVLRSSPSL